MKKFTKFLFVGIVFEGFFAFQLLLASGRNRNIGKKVDKIDI